MQPHPVPNHAQQAAETLAMLRTLQPHLLPGQDSPGGQAQRRAAQGPGPSGAPSPLPPGAQPPPSPHTQQQMLAARLQQGSPFLRSIRSALAPDTARSRGGPSPAATPAYAGSAPGASRLQSPMGHYMGSPGPGTLTPSGAPRPPPDTGASARCPRNLASVSHPHPP
jgi:hypothetical protein